MTENIIIALITLVGSVASSALLINWRLKELEKKVEKHNSYAEKFAQYTTNLAVMAKDIEFIKKGMVQKDDIQ